MSYLKSTAALALLAALSAGCSGSTSAGAGIPSTGSPVAAASKSGLHDGDTLGGIGDGPLALFSGVASAVVGSTVTGSVLNTNGGPVSGAEIVAAGAFGTAATARTNSNGAFTLHISGAGTYQINVENDYTSAGGRAFSASGNTNPSATVAGPSVTLEAGQTVSISITD